MLPVTIGMEQTEYTVGEVDDYLLVCFGVLSGNIDSREIVFDYTTASGTAGGTHVKRMIFLQTLTLMGDTFGWFELTFSLCTYMYLWSPVPLFLTLFLSS